MGSIPVLHGELDTKKSLKATLLSRAGAHEFFSAEVWRAAFTEFMATGFLIFTLTISIVSCLDSSDAAPTILVPFAVFVNFFLYLLLTVPLSGGHMNPILSFIAALKGLITPARAVIYIVAQCIGCVGCCLVLKSVMSHDVAEKYALGGCGLGGLNQVPALLMEFVCTFMLLFLAVTIAIDPRRGKELGLPMICAVIAATMAVAIFVSITVTGKVGYGGAGLNPARCFGAALVWGGPLWKGFWVFWLGPFLGCIAYYLFTLTLPKEGMVMQM